MPTIIVNCTYRSAGRANPPGSRHDVAEAAARRRVGCGCAVLVPEPAAPALPPQGPLAPWLTLDPDAKLFAVADVCLVLCPTEGMAGDLAAFADLLGAEGLTGHIMAVGEAIKTCPAEIALAASLDSGALHRALAGRKKAGGNGGFDVHSVRANSSVTHAWDVAPEAAAGGSALFGVLVALEIGYRLVLTNARLDEERFAGDRPAWAQASRERRLEGVFAFAAPQDDFWLVREVLPVLEPQALRDAFGK